MSNSRRERLRISLYGAVQGVGFRPFVYRLAAGMQLPGWVLNSGSGLVVEVEGEPARLDEFQRRLIAEKPSPAVILSQEVSRLVPAGFSRFEIRSSDEEAGKTVCILPDLATCPDCLSELLNPANRRFRYHFTNCTNCGPRYTIVLDIPYDRPRTTMREFSLCSDCQAEYTSPVDRRFHAQPNACPVCGPHTWLEAPAGTPVDSGTVETSISGAGQAIREGRVVAMKGIGGFQLLVDARNAEAVATLRARKHREEKPFAVMMPDVAAVQQHALVSEEEEAVLRSTAAPIVLLIPREAAEGPLAANVAHNTAHLGVMLPYSPLHHLLMRECPFPIVATSGNRSDEPIAIDNEEARQRLGGIADVFLMHNRPIARHCDDSVVRVLRVGRRESAGESSRIDTSANPPGSGIRCRESMIRRARGYAPLPVRLPDSLRPILAVGAHLKNTVAIAVGQQVFLSQHIGDLDTLEARQAFETAIDDLCRLYRFHPEAVACDLHPDYASTQWARKSGLPVIGVQHHQAHVAACAAENGITERYLGVSWDGTGYGLDGTVWGGEFFLVDGGRYERVAHLRPFRLPGGEAAVREGWRSAAGLLWELGGAAGVPDIPQKDLVCRMLERGINSPVTTSMGRLFDAVAALCGVARMSHFEGQAAMLLERAIDGLSTRESYPLPSRAGIGDWGPLLEQVVKDVHCKTMPQLIAARFHNALTDWILFVAKEFQVSHVVMSGGVFQNRYLVEQATALLEAHGMGAYTHQRVPANDGGISLGQIALANAQLEGD